MVICLVWKELMLRLMFGRVETDVMEAGIIYLQISAYSFPALAVYNAGAALCRSMGKTSITMYISVVSNVVNIVGNAIGIFILHAGVAGVAYPSLISRVFSAIAITAVCFSEQHAVKYRLQHIFRWNSEMLRRILGVAVPNGLRAAGDVRFTMLVSLLSTIFCRLLLSVVMGIWCGWGVIGVTVAMCCDWGLRLALYNYRYKSGKWKQFTALG